MKSRFLVPLSGLLLAVGCTQPTSSSLANLIGTHDLVLVDEPGEGGLLAGTRKNPDDGVLNVTGVPSRFLFVTSADTNELRVLENYRTGLSGRNFVRAPNPLETLSIPVLDRPTMLAADEGRNARGARVTGAYVYAARPGAAEVSVVSLSSRRQLGGRPMATPGPVTALGAYMEVDASASELATPRPATTSLFVATWDGAFASVYRANIATDSPELERLSFERVALIAQTPIAALKVVAPLATRTLDGAPFCATTACLALAARAGAGQSGDALLLDPVSGRTAALSFGGPVRYLAASQYAGRLYGILDEQACGSPACGGVVGVDLVTGTSAAGFPGALDALGAPMAPLRQGLGLITGLTISSGGTLRQTVETDASDAGTPVINYQLQEYQELGAFASSDGFITFFSGLGGSVLDFDPRRSVVTEASVRTPGLLPDGGDSFAGEDGGVLGSLTGLTVTTDLDLAKTWRTSTVDAGVGAWTVDISDGYLRSQSVAVVSRGQIPGLVNLATTAADGTRLWVAGGLEARALVGDGVRFETGNETLGYQECGRSSIAAIGAGFLEAAAIPTGCEQRVRFSVRASDPKALVVAADLEGYLGRWAPGETLTYNRPHVLLPAGVTAARTALTIQIPAQVPAGEGAFISFGIQGHMTPFQIAVDTSSIGCYTQLPGQVVAGQMVMAQVPTSISGTAAIDFRWTLYGVVPSGNGLAEFNLSLTRAAPLGLADGANCWR